MEENYIYSHEKNALILMPGKLPKNISCLCGTQDHENSFDWWRKALSTLRKNEFNVLLNSIFLNKKEVFHYIKYFEHKGFGLYAFGHDLDKSFIEELESKNLKHLQIPLHSVNPRTYNSISGVKGGFEKFWEFIDSLNQKENFLLFDVCITKKNLTEILPTIGWIINFGLAKSIIRLPSKENNQIEKLWPAKNSEILNILDYLIQTKKEFGDIFVNTEFETLKKYYLEEESKFSINNQFTICSHGCLFNHKFMLIKKLDKPDLSKIGFGYKD